MKVSFIAIIISTGTVIWFVFLLSNQFSVYEKQFSIEQCVGGPYCNGGMPTSASVGNRTLEVALKCYSNFTIPNNVHYLWFRFFDARTNQTLHHISFLLTVTNQNQLLFRELLHTHTGILYVKVISTSGPKWNVTANREPILNGWVPYNDDEPIVVHAPLFNDDNSTYHLNIQIDSIDYDNNLFASSDNPNSVPNFNFYLNMKEQNQIIVSPNLTVPEFPLAVPVLLIGTTSLIVFTRITIRNQHVLNSAFNPTTQRKPLICIFRC